jgi:hypothetical protein
VAEDVSANVIGMIVRHQGAIQSHTVAVSYLNDGRDVPCWINNHAYPLFIVSNKIDEVRHLRCKVVRLSKIPAREKLSNIETHYTLRLDYPQKAEEIPSLKKVRAVG